MKNKKPSILFALVDQDKDLVVYRRAGVTDPIQEDVKCPWTRLPHHTRMSDEFDGRPYLRILWNGEVLAVSADRVEIISSGKQSE